MHCGYSFFKEINIIFQINTVFFNTKENQFKLLNSTAIFNIDNNNNKHPISILELFLKDHVTLKTEKSVL